jgi:DNA-binding transcriptional LysR family regulator
MELRQLEYLVTVVEEANFTRAAQRCHVAQPGVSAQVRQLERELGLALLDRSGRTVRPTEAGAAVLPYARAALDAVGGILLAVDELSGLVRGHLAVGMVASLSAIDLPALLAGFAYRHPGVEITLTEASSASLLDALAAHRLDAAFVGLPGPAPAGIEAQVVAEVPLVAVVTPTDALSAEKTITLEALARRPLITLPQGTGLRTVIDRACASAGVQPRVAFEASDPHVLAQLAGQGLGVAIVTEPVAHAHRDRLHALAIIRPRMRGRLALAWRAQGPTSPATRTFISHARATLTDGQGACSNHR